MRSISIRAMSIGMFTLSLLGASIVAAQANAAGLPCARTTIAARRAPTGPAQYQSGSLRLGNGAVLRLQGTSAEMAAVRAMAIGDPVAACHGPRRIWADAPPSGTITVLDLANGEFYGTRIGDWPSRSR